MICLIYVKYRILGKYRNKIIIIKYRILFYIQTTEAHASTHGSTASCHSDNVCVCIFLTF